MYEKLAPALRVARWFFSIFQKIANLGQFWRALDGKMLIYLCNGNLKYFKDIWDTL
jgi:hypothetical protein